MLYDVILSSSNTLYWCLGIGQGRVTNNVKGAPVDYAIMVSDDESVSMVRKRTENLYSYNMA